MNVCERVSMLDGFAPPYTLEQWVNYNPHSTGCAGQRTDNGLLLLNLNNLNKFEVSVLFSLNLYI